MNASQLDFYFDFISPYAYFAWQRITQLCDREGAELRVHPVVFGKLLDHWGQLGPAEIPPKREWLYKYCYRYAKLQGLAFSPPPYHPFNPLPALRLALPEVAGERQRQVIGAIFDAGWGQGQDIGAPDTLRAVLDNAGLEGHHLIDQTAAPAVKERLKQETQTAIERGVFGVPTTIVNGELFWGNDQFEHIALCLAGHDPLDVNAVREVLARPRAVDRKSAPPTPNSGKP